MGSIYRRTQKTVDPQTGQETREAIGPFWIKYYRHGRPFRESARTDDRAEAKRLLKQREGEIASGRFRGLQVDRTTFEDLADDLRAYYQMNKQDGSPRGTLSAVQRFEEALAHLRPAFKGLRATEITSDTVQRYIAKRQADGAANGTINRETGMLKRMFSLALKQTPPKVMQAPHIPHLREENVRSGFFEHEDFLALRGALPDYAQVPVSLAYYSGMRMGEVFSLRWEQIHFREGRLYLKSQDTKTREPRVLYLTSDLSRVLETWKARTDAQWPGCPWVCHHRGRPLASLKSTWQSACVRVGVGQMVQREGKKRKVYRGRTPHDFRRTAIRNMVRAGVPEKVAMLISGHRTRSVFNRYNIVNETDLQAAAERLSGYFSKQMGTISGTVAELQAQREVESVTEMVEN